jgi:hypothetical protein
MTSTAVRPTSRFGFYRFFYIAFRLDSILNKQKIIKRIAFLVKMAKIASFRPNHKIFSGLVARSKLKKKCVAYPQEDFLFTILYGDS